MRLKHVEYFNEACIFLLNVVQYGLWNIKFCENGWLSLSGSHMPKYIIIFYAEATCKIPSFFTTDIVAGLFCIGDDAFITNSLRCLVLLLTTSKTKKHDGDVPYFMKFVTVCYVCRTGNLTLLFFFSKLINNSPYECNASMSQIVLTSLYTEEPFKSPFSTNH